MRVAFIGDVHGQAIELMRMLRRLEAHGVDRIISLGDLVDRGPASVECVRIVRTWEFTTRKGKQRCVEAILGNHEENHLYAHYKRVLPGRNFVPKTQHQDVTNALTEADYRWLDRLPLLIQVKGEHGERFTAVHGGFHPDMKTPGWYGKHRASKLCRIGYFGPNGEILSPYASSGRFWADEYDGRFGQVFFGHTSHQKVTAYKHAVAVDASKYGRLAAVVVSTEADDQPLACFYEEHAAGNSYKTSYTPKEPSHYKTSGSSRSSTDPWGDERHLSKETRGEQKSLFTKEDLDKRPSVTTPPPPGSTPLPPPKITGETKPRFDQKVPPPEAPKSPPTSGGPAGQKTDDWLKRIGVRADDTKDW